MKLPVFVYWCWCHQRQFETLSRSVLQHSLALFCKFEWSTELLLLLHTSHFIIMLMLTGADLEGQKFHALSCGLI